MQVNLDKTFPIAAPASSAWQFLQDIPGVAGCMPGAEVTETIDDKNYKGRVKDTKGSSSATMDLRAWVVDEGDGQCALKGEAQVAVTGKAASLGGRMMTQVADQILNQFGKNFANNVVAMGQGADAEGAREELAEQPKEVNGLAFVWSVIAGLVRSLFGHKKANSH